MDNIRGGLDGAAEVSFGGFCEEPVISDAAFIIVGDHFGGVGEEGPFYLEEFVWAGNEDELLAHDGFEDVLVDMFLGVAFDLQSEGSGIAV